ncbi:MAG: hypothetical protein HY731_11355, partial [Candidatus Tectomicrobia bacterium]|nr:hypothetical protein [Candidatus Tectomicrobia bacterium]
VRQHSLTSGKDRRGIRYQTDLALRDGKQPGLELVRYYQPDRPDGGEFGNGWHLLIPYRVKPVGTATREFLNVIIPAQMAVENLLTGEQEVLTFNPDRYTIAGYAPDKLEASQVLGLFLMSDASYRLVDKLGNEFRFDQAGYLTDMIFFQEHHIHFEYLKTFTTAFEQTPYRLQPADGNRIQFLNTCIPKRMKITDLLNGYSEVLVFSNRGTIAGYIPENRGKSRVQILALLSDASFRLLDTAGNEIAFNPAGEFTGMAVSPERRMVASVSHGHQRVNFTYTLDRSGQIRIASAHLTDDKGGIGPTYLMYYQYNDEGRLSRVIGPASQTAQLQPQSKGR